jgi:opacity protein-like surface antigen
VKKGFLSLAILLVFITFSLAQTADERKFELNLLGGFALSQLDGTSIYSDSWSLGSYDITEDTDLAVKAKGSASFLGFFSFYVMPNFGFQVGFGYLQPKIDTESSFAYTYNDTVENANWTGDSNLSVIPLSFNLIGRYESGNFGLYASGGGTLFMNKFNADSFVGFGWGEYSYYCLYIWIWPYYYYVCYYDYDIDAFKIPVQIEDTSWTAFGGNIGAGFDYKIAQNIALVVDARYYFCPKKEFDWEWQPGTYTSIFYEEFTSYNLSQSLFDALEVDTKTTSLTVNPSFFIFSAGIKILF